MKIFMTDRNEHFQISAIGTVCIKDGWFVALGEIKVTSRRGNRRYVAVITDILEYVGWGVS